MKQETSLIAHQSHDLRPHEYIRSELLCCISEAGGSMGLTPFWSQPLAASRWISVLVTSVLVGFTRESGRLPLGLNLIHMSWQTDISPNTHDPFTTPLINSPDTANCVIQLVFRIYIQRSLKLSKNDVNTSNYSHLVSLIYIYYKLYL